MTEFQRLSRDSATLVAGVVAAQVIGGLVPQLSPLMIDGFMKGLSLSEREAGFVVTVELFALAIAAIAIAPVLTRCSHRRVSLAAGALALLAQAASIFSVSLATLTLLRGFAGIGEGVLYAVSLAIVASRFRNPDKVYGTFQAGWALGSVALFALGGQLTAAYANRGILALIAGVTVALAPFLLLVPRGRAKAGDADALDLERASPLLGVMTLAATALYLTASAAVYAFTVPLGARAGLGTGEVGFALTIGTLIGLAGAGAATVINVRWGRAIPISAFCVGFMLATLALYLARSSAAYVAALFASFVVYYFSIPYLFGLAAALDRSGRWAAATSSAYLLGFAAGPLVGGAVIAWAGYGGLVAVCVGLTVAAWGLAMVVCRHLGGHPSAKTLA